MPTIHFVLQGKGGVGKSMIAAILYQTIEALGHEVKAFDTDPVNATLKGFKDFKEVTSVNLLAPDGNIDSRLFDGLINKLEDMPEDIHIIVDNGASSFVTLGSYMKASDTIETIEEELGYTVYFHTVITGGQALVDTLNGFSNLVEAFPSSRLVVWLNPFFGAIEIDGKSFVDFKVAKEHEENIHAIIELPMGNKDLIGKDIEQMLARRMSFYSAINSSGQIAVRSRLKKYWKTILSYVERANFC
jgi:hypothetical protein